LRSLRLFAAIFDSAFTFVALREILILEWRRRSIR
jgi:hypothetical protein